MSTRGATWGVVNLDGSVESAWDEREDAERNREGDQRAVLLVEPDWVPIPLGAEMSVPYTRRSAQTPFAYARYSRVRIDGAREAWKLEFVRLTHRLISPQDAQVLAEIPEEIP